MIALYKKEINNFFSSIIGYIVIIVFLVINSLFLWVFPSSYNVITMGYASIDGLFNIAPYVFLFLIPAITMRFFAEERRTGTIELLLTKPISDMQIIAAKFFAGFTLLIIALIPTLIYFYSVYQLGYPPGNIDTGGMWGSYLGLLFLGGAFVAIGLFASSITNNQIVSFIVSMFLCSFAFMGFQLIFTLGLFGELDLLIYQLGINAHYSSMSRGVIDTRDIIYFLSIIGLFMVLTKIALESRKW